MCSIKVRLNKFRVTKEGTYPLVFQVIHRRKKKVIYSPFRLFSDSFDESSGRVISRKRKQLAATDEINRYITSICLDLQRTISHLELRGEDFSVSDIVELYKSGIDGSQVFIYMQRLITSFREAGRIGTANAYQSTFNRISHFVDKTQHFSFSDLNVSWLNRFIFSLQQSGLQPNTVNFYIRILRATYNRASRESIPGTDRSPFSYITLKTVKTVKRAIDCESIQRIAKVNLAEMSYLDISRDFFLFSYYTRGMSFVDMAFLKYENISNGTIYYVRSKTKQPMQVKIVEPLNQLINKYKNMGEYVLPILCGENKSLYNSYRSSLKRHNKNLKALSVLLKLPVPLTSYVARHSWATIARQSGIPVSVISEALGHSSEKITYTYLAALNPSVVDAANELISSFVRKKR